MARIPTLKNVLLTLQNGVALTRFNRPRSGNSLSHELFSDMHAALKWATTTPEVRVIVHSGEGKFYCTGMELSPKPASASSADDSPIDPAFIDTLKSYHDMLITTDKVTVAAVNGPAVGWGVSSLALHDLVYSVEDAYFFTPFIKWGMCAEACSSFSFASVMGWQKAMGMILAGERMTARELEGVGMVTKCLPKEGFLDKVVQIAERVASQPTESLRVNKELVRMPVREALLEANRRECEELVRRAGGEEAKRAIRLFEEEQKRKRESKM